MAVILTWFVAALCAIGAQVDAQCDCKSLKQCPGAIRAGAPRVCQISGGGFGFCCPPGVAPPTLNPPQPSSLGRPPPPGHQPPQGSFGGQQPPWARVGRQQPLWQSFGGQQRPQAGVGSQRPLGSPGGQQPPQGSPGGQQPPQRTPGSQQPPPGSPGSQQPPPGSPGSQQPPQGSPGGQQPPQGSPGGPQPPPPQGSPGSPQPPQGSPGGQQPPQGSPGGQQPPLGSPGSQKPPPPQGSPGAQQPPTGSPGSQQHGPGTSTSRAPPGGQKPQQATTPVSVNGIGAPILLAAGVGAQKPSGKGQAGPQFPPGIGRGGPRPPGLSFVSPWAQLGGLGPAPPGFPFRSPGLLPGVPGGPGKQSLPGNGAGSKLPAGQSPPGSALLTQPALNLGSLQARAVPFSAPGSSQNGLARFSPAGLGFAGPKPPGVGDPSRPGLPFGLPPNGKPGVPKLPAVGLRGALSNGTRPGGLLPHLLKLRALQLSRLGLGPPVPGGVGPAPAGVKSAPGTVAGSKSAGSGPTVPGAKIPGPFPPPAGPAGGKPGTRLPWPPGLPFPPFGGPGLGAFKGLKPAGFVPPQLPPRFGPGVRLGGPQPPSGGPGVVKPGAAGPGVSKPNATGPGAPTPGGAGPGAPTPGGAGPGAPTPGGAGPKAPAPGGPPTPGAPAGAVGGAAPPGTAAGTAGAPGAGVAAGAGGSTSGAGGASNATSGGVAGAAGGPPPGPAAGSAGGNSGARALGSPIPNQPVVPGSGGVSSKSRALASPVPDPPGVSSSAFVTSPAPGGLLGRPPGAAGGPTGAPGGPAGDPGGAPGGPAGAPGEPAGAPGGAQGSAGAPGRPLGPRGGPAGAPGGPAGALAGAPGGLAGATGGPAGAPPGPAGALSGAPGGLAGAVGGTLGGPASFLPEAPGQGQDANSRGLGVAPGTGYCMPLVLCPPLVATPEMLYYNWCRLRDGSPGIICSYAGSRLPGVSHGLTPRSSVGTGAGSPLATMRPMDARRIGSTDFFKANQEANLVLVEAALAAELLVNAQTVTSSTLLSIEQVPDINSPTALFFLNFQSTVDTQELGLRAFQSLATVDSLRSLAPGGVVTVASRGPNGPSVAAEQALAALTAGVQPEPTPDQLPLVPPDCEPEQEIICQPEILYRTINGECNNLKKPRLGRALTGFKRLLPNTYDDGLFKIRTKAFRGGALPSARLVSERVLDTLSNELRDHTLSLMQFSQFVDHDLTHALVFRLNEYHGIECCLGGGTVFPAPPVHPQCISIPIPPEDPFYGPYGQACLPLVRSLPAPEPNCIARPATPLNELTSFLDSSNIYGSSRLEMEELRAYQDGLLLTSPENLLPLTGPPGPDMPCRASVCFRAGDTRVNQQSGLTVMHTIFMREHNRIAKYLLKRYPAWGEEELFEGARRIVIAEWQHIIYNEWLPVVIGFDYADAHGLLPHQVGFSNYYDPEIDPTISNSFATAAFRFYHTLMRDMYDLLDANGQVFRVVNVTSTYFEPTVISSGFVGHARTLVARRSEAFDINVAPSVHEQLFTTNFVHGLDLFALNIQQGRDHGIPTYAQAVEMCGIVKVRYWGDLHRLMDSSAIDRLRSVYDDPRDVDLFIGGVAERLAPGAQVGPTFQCLIGQQFFDLRYGDRFFYDNGGLPHSFTAVQLEEIRKTSWARVMCDTLGPEFGNDFTKVQPLAFLTTVGRNQVLNCNTLAIPHVDLSAF